jgi:hypothetical protein
LDRPDQYGFPAPDEAALMPFKYNYQGADVRTQAGLELNGYVSGPGLGVFARGGHFVFNRSLADLGRSEAHRLAALVGEPSVFPLRVRVRATQQTFDFALD